MERRAGRPSGDHQQRRQIVTEAVWSGLRDFGPDGASPCAVARETGCTTATLVHALHEKDAMLPFSISHMLDRTETRIAALRVPAAPLASIRAMARTLLQQSHETVPEGSAWLGFISRGQWLPEIGGLRPRPRERLLEVMLEQLLPAPEVRA